MQYFFRTRSLRLQQCCSRRLMLPLLAPLPLLLLLQLLMLA